MRHIILVAEDLKIDHKIARRRYNTYCSMVDKEAKDHLSEEDVDIMHKMHDLIADNNKLTIKQAVDVLLGRPILGQIGSDGTRVIKASIDELSDKIDNLSIQMSGCGAMNAELSQVLTEIHSKIIDLDGRLDKQAEFFRDFARE